MIPTIVLLVILVPAAVAASSAWEAVGSVLGDAAEPLPLLLTVVAFVGLWVVGLVLVAVVCAWRAAIWTVAEVGSQGDVRGVHRPPTGSLAARPLVCDAVARSVLGPVPTAR